MDTLPRYDDDFFAWTQAQARLLRDAAAERPNAPIDWDHLADEVESMGRSERRAAEGALTRILEHLFKLEFSPARDPRAGWMDSVDAHRLALRQDLRSSPSLRARLDVDACNADGRALAVRGLRRHGELADGTGAAMADHAYTLDQAVDPDWWPVNRHGLEE